MTSRRLCGGMFVAMPTAMPDEPLTSRFGKRDGQHARLFSRFVEVRVPVDGVLVDVAQHLVAELRHARLGVTVGRGGVAVDGAEVAVAVDERIAHGEVLRQTHQRVVDRRVAVRMIPAQHVADAGRATS